MPEPIFVQTLESQKIVNEISNVEMNLNFPHISYMNVNLLERKSEHFDNNLENPLTKEIQILHLLERQISEINMR